MKTDKGRLKKVKIGFLVTMSTRKGSADFLIPDAARCYRTEDAADGLEVDVERDEKNRITKVTIPGKPVVAVGVTGRPKSGPGGRAQNRPEASTGQGNQRPRRGLSQPIAVKGLPKASPRVLGMPFHNPYTFLPFPSKQPMRREVTPLTVDELTAQKGRFTGILELVITTESPLLSCHPDPVSDQNGHKTYQALTIGPDVIVPATGVRGSLRTLMTILTGGTLGYLNEHAYLIQGRDANLGPRGANSPYDTPVHVFLAEVVEPGTEFKDGKVRLGQTRLVQLDTLERANKNQRLQRGPNAPTLWVGLDAQGQPVTVSSRKTDQTPWRLKASGRPINLKGKREGLFLADGHELTLPSELWAAYSGRHAHADRTDLRKGDLIWLEPTDPHTSHIIRPEDVKSLQWARWGRHGESLKARVPHYLWPDYMRDDGQADEVTDLFGQVSTQRGDASVFAARLRTENVVFFNAASKVERVPLAPLAPPHPGCTAFYRDNTDADDISETDALRGYKVYRTQDGQNAAPWRFETQGVYDKQGNLLRPQQRVNKTCDLVPKAQQGTLRIAFRSLTTRELALVLRACAVPWRLGGGKPLGLGLCEVQVARLIDEEGQPLQVPGWRMTASGDGLVIQGWEKEVNDIQDRVQMWRASQMPVAMLRYPRAVDDNRFGKSRGGHAWFQRHAKPRMVTGREDSIRESGLEPLYIGGAMKESAQGAAEPLDAMIPMIAGQPLPIFNMAEPEADVLYGYDAINAKTEDQQRPRRRVFLRLEAFDPSLHVTGDEQSEGNQGRNAKFREAQKRSRINQ